MILNIANIIIAINNISPKLIDSNYLKKVSLLFSSGNSEHINHTINLTDFIKTPANTTPRQNTNYCETNNHIFIESPFFKIMIERNLKSSALFLKKTDDPPFYLLKAIKLVLSFIVIQRGGIPIHASAISSPESCTGFAFSGPPNAGKTTIALLLSIKENKILNDEFNIILPSKSGFKIYSTPFTTELKLNFCNNLSAPLRNIYFLKKSHTNFLEKQNKSKNYFKMLESVYTFPATEELGNKTLKNVEDIIRHVKPSLLYFKNDLSITNDFKNIVNNE